VLALAIVAAATAWNPIGAPFALVVGVAAAVLAVRALFGGAPRRLAAAALALGAGAAVGSVVVLLATLGLGVGPEEKLGVEPRSPAEMQRVLDEAAARSREARQRAADELERLPPPAPGSGEPPR
jgi:hypothetical protein